MSIPLIRLKELCEVITKGTTPTSLGLDFSDNGVGFLRVQNVSGGKVNFERDTLFINEQVHQGLRRSQILPGDVLLSIAGTIGRTGVVPKNAPPLNCNQAIAIIRSTGKVFRSYLRHWLESNNAQSQMRESTVTGTIQNLSLAQVGSLKVPLPPLPEQIRIAAILDQADALRAKRREALAQLDSLTQSIFIEMFGAPATNPRGWNIEYFGDICENQDAQRVPVKSSDRDDRQGAFPYYGASGIIDWVDDYIYEGERLLIGEDGANLLARVTPVAYIAQEKFWVNNHAHVVAYNGCANLRFLEFFIEQIDLKPYISGSAQPKLNRSNLDRIPVMLPPLEMQRAFAERIALVEKLKTDHRASLTELDALFASLQHRAFRGEL